MKLTPLDIHHKEFHRAIRGYNEEEVDKFLDEVAEEFERLFKENIELKEQAEKVRQQLEGYSGMEKTLQSTLLTAQRSAEDVVVHARKEAELVVRDAEVKAKEVIQEAYDLKGKYEATLSHLKDAEVEFRNKFKSMLESYMRIADSTAVLADIGNNISGLEDKPSPELEQLISKKQDFDQEQEHDMHVAEIEMPQIGMVGSMAQAVPENNSVEQETSYLMENEMERPIERPTSFSLDSQINQALGHSIDQPTEQETSAADSLASRLVDDLSQGMSSESMDIGLSLDDDESPLQTPSAHENDFMSEYSSRTFTPEDLLADQGSSPSMSEYRGTIEFGLDPFRNEKNDEDEDDKPDKFDLDSLAF